MKKAMVIIAGGALIVGIGFYFLFSAVIGVMNEHKEARDIYNTADSRYVSRSVKENKKEDIKTPGDEQATSPEVSASWWELADVDMDTLGRDNPDAVAWIFFENEDISYPVMYVQGDNEKYLHTTYTGQENTAGSIFIDGSSSPDLSDPHTIIYGHNMRNLNMFGHLRHYRNDPDYYKNHMYFQIFTGYNVLRYQIFACEKVPTDSIVYKSVGPDFKDMSSLKEEITSHASYQTGVSLYDSDRLVTLSTCVNDENYRWIVSAVLIDSHWNE